MKKIIEYEGDFGAKHNAVVTIDRAGERTTVTITEERPNQLWLMNAAHEFARLIQELLKGDLAQVPLDAIEVIYQPHGEERRLNDSVDDLCAIVNPGPPPRTIPLTYKKPRFSKQTVLAGDVEVIPLV
ncbi:MAG: hypothetical protein ABW131_09620 [Candidatus Sedimenticola sp. 6PFRAG5]